MPPPITTTRVIGTSSGPPRALVRSPDQPSRMVEDCQDVVRPGFAAPLWPGGQPGPSSILPAMEASNAKLALSPVTRRKLTEAVVEQLLAAIRELPPGTRVPSERELTRELGVGRSTVREALNGLAMLGVLTIRHGQGAFISDDGAAGTPADAPHASLTAALERAET